MEKKSSRKEDLESAKKWAYENLLNKTVYHKDIHDYINFNKAGIDHLIFAKTYDQKIKMIYSAVELIKRSRLFAIEKDKRERKDTKAILKFVSIWQDEGHEYFVYIIVRETVQGKYYYDHNIIKQKP